MPASATICLANGLVPASIADWFTDPVST